MGAEAKINQFPQVYTVEASAGSGKTYALAKRYLRLLINPSLGPEEIPLNAILAITFTNKAAIEMKERILDFLKRIALDKFSTRDEKEEVLSGLGVKEEVARLKAFRITDAILGNYNFFQVQTIDSFINAMLCGCAFKLGLSASFKTRNEYWDYLLYSLDRLIDSSGSDKEVLSLFTGFLKQYLFIEHKTSWFPKQHILSTAMNLFIKYNKHEGAFLRSDIDPKVSLTLKKNILGGMGTLRSGLPEGTHKAFLNSLSHFLERNKDGFGIDELPGFFNWAEFPLNKGYSLPPETAGLWEKIRSDLRELCELESASVYNYYIDIFNQILVELKRIADKDDTLFLEALNKEARRLFDEKSLACPELYYRLATRLRHFLIDEFQDTSVLQWQNIFLMLEEALATGGSLFYVGDKKQAIYRFRGGEVSLLDSARSRFRGVNVIEESLVTNYRSQKAIVEFNNQVFSEGNLRNFLGECGEQRKNGMQFAASDIDEIIKVFSTASQRHIPGKTYGYVLLEHVDEKDRQQQEGVLKEKLLETIEDIRKRFSFKDIALLVRRNAEVEVLTAWLLEHAIPVESEKTLDIRQNPFIKELIAFLKFLHSPIDNLSFASFVTGDIFSRASGIPCEQIHDFLFRLRRDGHRGSGYLYREFRKGFPQGWEALLEEFFKNVGLVPLYEFVISILGRFRCFEFFPDSQGFFMRFLELIKEQEDEYPSIPLFLEFFETASDEEFYVNVTESDAVKILTIHKAKGLEFPAVIVPFLEMHIKLDSGVVFQEGSNLRLLHLKQRYADFSERLKLIYRREYMKSFIDELNSVYVALTRAADELYIFVSRYAESGFNTVRLLFPPDNLERGEKREAAKRARAGDPLLKIPPSLYKDWIPLLKEEFIDESTLRTREQVLKGEILHTLLSFIGNMHGCDKDMALKRAVEKTRMRFPFISSFEEYKLIARNLLARKELQGYFDAPEATEVYVEKEIVDTLGNTKRVDRLVVTPSEVIVIDYKATREDFQAHRQQVAEYMEIVKDIYPRHDVRGFVLYLDDFGIEEVA